MKKEIVIIAALIIFTNAVYANTEWSMFGGGAAHPGWGLSFAPNYSLYSTTGLVNSTLLSSGSISNNPIIKNKIVYINGPSGISLKNITSGAITTFSHNVGGTQYSSPVIASNKYCYVSRSNLSCRYLANNSLAWSYATQASVTWFEESSPMYANGKIWIGSRSRRVQNTSAILFAFNENNSIPLYQIIPPKFTFPNGVKENASVVYTPAISGGKVFVGLDYPASGKSSRILAVYENNGSVAWNRFMNLGEGVLMSNSPSIGRDKLFIAVQDNAGVDQRDDILALNKNDGSLAWQAEIINASQGASNLLPVLYADKLFLVSTDSSSDLPNSYVYAYNESNGNLIWARSISGLVGSSPSVADSMLIIATNNVSTDGVVTSNIYGLSTLDGKVAWQYSPGIVLVQSIPAIVNNTVYLGDADGNLVELKAKVSRTISVTINADEKTMLLVPEANAVIEVAGKSNLITPVTGNVIVTRKIDENPNITRLQKLNKFLSIRTTPAVLIALKYVYIKLYYTEDELKSLGLDESQLKMYSFSTDRWNVIAGSGGDANGNFVFANLTGTNLTTMSSVITTEGIGGFALEQDEESELNIGGGGNQKDSDNDGVIDEEDNCANTNNAGQEDSDLDGIGNQCDNCIQMTNGNQANNDNDALGDSCDEDDDNDGELDSQDNCPFVAFAPELDYDGDGADDGCDRCQLLASESTSGLANIINLNNTLNKTNSIIVGNDLATADINLLKGFNLISLPIVRANNDIRDVLASINGKYSILWAFRLKGNELEWRSYNPSKPDFLQSLTSFNNADGYWINMLENSTLSLDGVRHVTSAFVLSPGLNLIGYPSLEARSSSEVFSNVSGDLDKVLGYNSTTDEFLIYSPSLPAEMNTLNMLEPGSGYWVNITRNVSWVFENGRFAKASSYPDLFIATPTREALVSIMSNNLDGVIPRWQLGGCDLVAEGNSVACQQPQTKLQEFKDMVNQQKGSDISEKAADWMISCLESFK